MELGDLIKDAIKQLPNGAFLMAGRQGNPMTIGWAQWGVIWGKPIMMVMVRHSRFSHGLMDCGEFTVSFPAPTTMAGELKICGTRSGRDTDKMGLAGLERLHSRAVSVPSVKGCAIHFECKIMLKSEIALDDLEHEAHERFYPGGEDYHTIYFGEIVAAYREGE